MFIGDLKKKGAVVISVHKDKTFPWSIFLEVKIQSIMMCASLLNTSKLISKSPWIPTYEPKLELHWNCIEFIQSFRGRGIILYNIKCSYWWTLFYLHLGLFSISFIMFFVKVLLFSLYFLLLSIGSIAIMRALFSLSSMFSDCY